MDLDANLMRIYFGGNLGRARKFARRNLGKTKMFLE